MSRSKNYRMHGRRSSYGFFSLYPPDNLLGPVIQQSKKMSSSRGSMIRRNRPVSFSRLLGGTCSFCWSMRSKYDHGKDEAGDMSEVWEDGTGGFQWKARHLAERRSVALDYMGNVARRVPIHDAIRIRAKLGRDRLLREVSGPSPVVQQDPDSEIWRPVSSYSSSGNLSGQLTSGSDDSQTLDEQLESLLAEETIDTLSQLTDDELGLLRDEFYGQTTASEDDDDEIGSSAEKRTRTMLEDWYRVRKTSSQYEAYCAVPPQERTAWSAWYLRDVKARPDDGDGNKPL